MRTTTNINKNWLFKLADDATCKNVEADESAFSMLNLPHDWSNDYELSKDASTNGGGGYCVAGTGWYRKHLNFDTINETEKYYLYFEGVYMNSTVYVNGNPAGGHCYGYTSFYVDITKYIIAGDNIIAVRVNNSQTPNSRWYSGSGIQRNVYLVTTGNVHFAHFGIRAATNGIYSDGSADLSIRADVTNESDSEKYLGITHRIKDADGNIVSTSGISLCLAAGETSECVTRPGISDAHLWSDKTPYLYTLESELSFDGCIIDRYSVKTGIRTAVFDSNKGFLLNGVTTKIKGMCVHHDCGLTGAVGLRESWERRLLKLKKMGCNGIRTSHNPPAPVLLELCDELGFLVMDEAYDEWFLSKNKTDNYYSEALAYGSAMFFKNHAKEDLTAMIRRDYNHPSVILWSIGNEIPEQSSVDGPSIAKFLQDICHEEDSTRMVTCACDNIVAAGPGRARREFENTLDVVGYNYVGRWRNRAETFYEEDREAFPDRRFIGTENPSVGGVRGNYSFDGWFGNYSTQTMHHEALWRYTVAHDFVAGDYLWTGVDYLGETRWPRRGAPCGPLDTAGFEKDSYYYFKSIWNKDEITLYIAPSHWNFEGEEGSYRPVVCYTNCDEVKLYINGKYVGSRGYECPRYGCVKAWNDTFNKHLTTNDLHLSFDVMYEPGELKAEGYVNGELVAVTRAVTAGPFSRLSATAFPGQYSTDGLVQIELSATDSNGVLAETACPTITCHVSGNAHLVGMDSGDLADLTLYASPTRKMFNGKLLCAVMVDGPGDITVSFTTDTEIKEDFTFTAV